MKISAPTRTRQAGERRCISCWTAQTSRVAFANLNDAISDVYIYINARKVFRAQTKKPQKNKPPPRGTPTT